MIHFLQCSKEKELKEVVKDLEQQFDDIKARLDNYVTVENLERQLNGIKSRLDNCATTEDLDQALRLHGGNWVETAESTSWTTQIVSLLSASIWNIWTVVIAVSIMVACCWCNIFAVDYVSRKK